MCPLLSASASHAGLVRASNEDVVRIEDGIAVVADGMGGYEGGEIAAQIAADQALRSVRRERSVAGLRRAIAAANRRVCSHAVDCPDLMMMGTTLVVVALMEDLSHALVAHIGDSRAYLLRRAPPSSMPPSAAPRWAPPVSLASGTSMVCLTRDHSTTCARVEHEKITREEGLAHPHRSRLQRVVGRIDADPADARSLPLRAGDRLLLCSDGLWGLLPDETIAHLIDTSPGVEACCETLVQAALDAGGTDNVSVAMLLAAPGAR